MSTFLLVLILAGVTASQVTGNPSLDPSDNSSLQTWVVVGVTATTTLLVLIILVPTIIYYKRMHRKGSPNGVLKI